MASNKQTDQGRNSTIDKTNAAHSSADPFANQGAGKLGSGNENSGHPANDVIIARDRKDADKAPSRSGENINKTDCDTGRSVKGSKGSGMPTLSGAGQLADDRPGHNDLKSERATASLNKRKR